MKTCFFNNCEKKATATWINGKKEKLPICDEDLRLLQTIYFYEILNETTYRALPSEDKIEDLDQITR